MFSLFLSWTKEVCVCVCFALLLFLLFFFYLLVVYLEAIHLTADDSFTPAHFCFKKERRKKRSWSCVFLFGLCWRGEGEQNRLWWTLFILMEMTPPLDERRRRRRRKRRKSLFRGLCKEEIDRNTFVSHLRRPLLSVDEEEKQWAHWRR